MIKLSTDGTVDHHLARREVVIYQDPVTESNREGKARVVRVVAEDTPHYRRGDTARRLIRCDVEFLDEPGATYFRAIQIERIEL